MKTPASPETILALANRMHLASEDMSEINSFFFWREKPELMPEIVDPVFLAAIVVYARPFVRSQSGGHAVPKLDPVEIGMFERRADLEHLHNIVMERRNRAVAHTDWTYHRTALRETDTGLRRIKTRVEYASNINFDAFLDLVRHVSSFTSQAAYELDLQYLELVGGLPPVQGGATMFDPFE